MPFPGNMHAAVSLCHTTATCSPHRSATPNSIGHARQMRGSCQWSGTSLARYMLPLTTASCNNLQTFRLAPSSVAAGAAANIAARLAERDLPVDADLLRLLRTVVWQVRISCCRTWLNMCQNGGGQNASSSFTLRDAFVFIWKHCYMSLTACSGASAER